MATKYIKEKGLVRATTTTNFELEKPLINENYDISVHNRNMDKIDRGMKEFANRLDEFDVNVNGQRLRGINIANTLIDKLEG